MAVSIQAFYDDFASAYHRLYADWSVSIRRQAEILDRLIQQEFGSRPQTILDCTAGIGTQALGLAECGYQVTATDLSPKAIARLRQEAAARDLTIETQAIDLRAMAANLSGRFDVVISCDNALPHFLTDTDLITALTNIHAKVRPGGLLLASIRDYDRLRAERPSYQPPRVVEHPDGRHITLQLWDWNDTGTHYRLHQFMIQQLPSTSGDRNQAGDQWQTTHLETDYRALTRQELKRAVSSAGFANIRWHAPDTSGYYQPILTARRSG